MQGKADGALPGLHGTCGETDRYQAEGQGGPIRIYYNRNIYRGFPKRKSKSVEINQVGIELIGGSTVRSDLEVIGLAAKKYGKYQPGKVPPGTLPHRVF